ncbi:toll/interleukin-1 receptor domain-containing protein [Paenibacillus camelliae]|uniref:toll/interleukin-1 receptor domain-containing protein n=1 Tax=Paenibacillus camelliae TaxID=512410 RepID=UPI0020419599|nr:toll/interleukin-1 receptor domain-containing protein [Paenibacillus camelliae]MCM3634261.1 TIR domain-containing protein [Paenibacillus camelliae]
MPRVFLSHSSQDKESYVRYVAEKLIKEFGIHSVVYDEVTFEEGMKSIEEIELGLESTDVFVIFLSNHALNSRWVKLELTKAYELLSNKFISRIYPIIIDQGVTYQDVRIPEWMRNEYNIKYISRPSKSFNMIKQRLIEISWNLHPRIKEKDRIFVGRNDLITVFEERFYDYSKEKPLCFIASGIESIGRNSVLKHCFIKANVFTKESYQPNVISLNAHQSIEDFIYLLYGLGYSESVNIENLLITTLEEKVEIALKLVSDIQSFDEKVFIRDNGCIVAFDGTLTKWFLDIINGIKNTDRVIFGIISSFVVRFKEVLHNERIFSIEVSELQKKERDGLLNRYLNFEDISLSMDDFKYFSNLQKGYPEQVYYTVSLLKREGVNNAKRSADEIINYSNDKVSKLISKYEDDSKCMEFLYFLSLFDAISYSFIFNIIGSDDYYEDKLREFSIMSICSFIGTNKEYIKLNDAIKDYVLRSGYSLNKEFEERLMKNLDEFLGNYSFEDFEIPDFLFTIKESIKRNKSIDTKYLIPSHFLKTMTELYDIHKNYGDVIRLADKALENIEFMDEKIVFEIRYFLCLSLARLRNKRFLEEVQNINGAEHNFLLGYYYRLVNNNERALEELQRSLGVRQNFSRAKRELVQVYIQLEEYEKAKQLAKEHYENDKTNPYHIQAYFTCIIKSDRHYSNKVIVEELLENLVKVKSTVAKEMLLRCQALFKAYYNNDRITALFLIEKAISEYPNLTYAIYNKFEICERFNMVDEMGEIVRHLEDEKKIKKGDYNFPMYVKSKTIFISMKYSSNEAMKFLESNKKYLSDSVFAKLIRRLEDSEDVTA